LAPLRRGMKRAGILPGDLPPGSDPVELAVARADKAPAIARHFVLEYTTDMAGNRNGDSLRDVLAPVTKRIKALTRYMVAARAMLLHSRGIQSGIDPQDARFIFQQHDSPEFQKALQGVTEWNQRLLDYVVEAGGLSEAAAKKIRELNPIYVPFMRAFAEGEKRTSGGIGKGLTRGGKAVKKIKGSGREIIEPLEAMIQQAERMIGSAHKSEVAKSLVLLEKSNPGLAGLIWKVPPPMQATRFTAEQLKKEVIQLAIDRLGVDPAEIAAGDMLSETWDEVLTVYTNASAYYGKDNIVSLVVDEKQQWYEVDPDLYAVLQGLDMYTLPRFLRWVGATTRMVRLGATGLNAGFGLIRNFLRDMGTFSVLSKHAKLGPLSAVAGVARDVAQTETAQTFKAMGGKMAGPLGYDRTQTQHLRGEMLASTIGDKVIHHAKHPVQALRELFGVTEAGTRIGEFAPALRYAEKKWGKGSKDAAIYALNQAQDVTTNFTRHGRIGKILNQIIPFFNAGIQGPDKVLRTFHERPARTTFAALACLTLPAMALWWRNKDEDWFKNLPAYERANYLHFRIPGTDTIVRIPVPFELGHLFQSIPVAVVDARYRDDPDGVREMFAEVFEQANPVDWPAAIGPLIDAKANKDWAGRPIVPKAAEYKLPEDQSKRYTTRLMREIGKVIRYSPAKLEYMVNAYSGGLYGRVSRSIGTLAGDKEMVMADYPAIGTLFLRDPFAPHQQVDRFYRRRDQLSRMKQSGKITPAQDRERLVHDRAARKLRPYWEKLREAKTTDERKRLYNAVLRIVEPKGQQQWR
ncbi:MAG TPA: LPD38 domain-containing protein, partial [Phycisphaerae bacterium]|nr:LPD38 domain-containing protein [Phycisphaerae bacterium]